MSLLREQRNRWEDDLLKQFIWECPSRVMLYSYPSRSFFSAQFSKEEWEAFLIREKEHTSDANGLKKLNHLDWKQLAGFNETDSPEQFISDFDKIKYEIRNGLFHVRDQQSKYFSFRHNRRVWNTDSLIYGQKRENPKVYMVGACNVLGLFCKYDCSIPFQLQQMLVTSGMDFDVINCGIWGSENILSSLWQNPYTEKDVVVLILTGFSKERLLKIDCSDYYGDFSEAFNRLPISEWYLWNNIAHHGVAINYMIASSIKEDFINLPRKPICDKSFRMKDYFIPWTIHEYYLRFVQERGISIKKNEGTVGAIVMNANPFTLGHKYLALVSSRIVDFLYVFVVEENLSEFSFADRIEMVRKGLSDIHDLEVISSGSYMISQLTFPDYFEKNHITEVRDMSFDLRVFGEVVAPIFNISIRFVGEEPNDIVTNAYNKTMKRVLSEKGIKVIEFPRLCIDKRVVSASFVRMLIREGKLEAIRQFVPETTYQKVVEMNES